jgi:organic radical activating enzyme
MGWKDPPPAGKKWLNRSLEIQVMLACNWRCCACDQLSQFPQINFVKRGTMTLAQIERFVAEMKEHNAYFGRIRLVGGEPSLHPKLVEIVQTLRQLIPEHCHQIELVTNGSHPEKLEPVRKLLKVRVSNAADKEKHHVANLAATPESKGYAGKRCNSPEHCGWSLSYYGFAPCSAGAGIMRLWDAMEHQRLTLPLAGKTNDNWPDIQKLCDKCYHGLRAEDKVRCGMNGVEKNQPEPQTKVVLDSWLSGKQPEWNTYG